MNGRARVRWALLMVASACSIPAFVPGGACDEAHPCPLNARCLQQQCNFQETEPFVFRQTADAGWPNIYRDADAGVEVLAALQNRLRVTIAGSKATGADSAYGYAPIAIGDEGSLAGRFRVNVTGNTWPIRSNLAIASVGRLDANGPIVTIFVTDQRELKINSPKGGFAANAYNFGTATDALTVNTLFQLELQWRAGEFVSLKVFKVGLSEPIAKTYEPKLQRRALTPVVTPELLVGALSYDDLNTNGTRMPITEPVTLVFEGWQYSTNPSEPINFK